jgi:hypothetical protein
VSYEGIIERVQVEQFEIFGDGVTNEWGFTYERVRDDTAIITVNQIFGNLGEPAEVEQEVLMERENIDFDRCLITFQNPVPVGTNFLVEVIGRSTKYKNNERIVTASNPGPKRRIWAARPDPTEPVPVYITPDTYHAFEPFVSWDGKKMVFTGNVDNPSVDTAQNLWVGDVFMYRGVFNLHKVNTSNRDLDFRYAPRMTRDNDVVVYIDGNGVRNRFQIKAYRISTETTSVLLDTTDKEISSIRLSPDDTVLFATMESTGATPGSFDRSILYIYDFDKNLLTLTNPRTYDESGQYLHAPQPSRALDKIIVARAATFSFTNMEIWQYDLDVTSGPYLSNPTQLKTAIGTTPVYSSDGTKIAFISSDDGSPTGSGQDVWIMNSNGSSQQLVELTAAVEEDPIWRKWVRP